MGDRSDLLCPLGKPFAPACIYVVTTLTCKVGIAGGLLPEHWSKLSESLSRPSGRKETQMKK